MGERKEVRVLMMTAAFGVMCVLWCRCRRMWRNDRVCECREKNMLLSQNNLLSVFMLDMVVEDEKKAAILRK